MVESNRSLLQAQLRASMSMAARVLARQRAIKAVKRALQAKGLKPQHMRSARSSLRRISISPIIPS